MKLFQRFKMAIVLTAIIVALQTPNIAMAGFDGMASVLAASALIVTMSNQRTNDDKTGDLTFVSSIGYQQKQLHFDQKYNAAAGNGSAKFDVDLPTGNISLTSSYSRFFVTAKYEKSLEDGTVTANEVEPSTPTYYLNIPGGITAVDREDMSLTLGYNVVDALNMFIGYMKGETTLKPEIGCSFVSPQASCDSNINPAGLSNLAFLHNYYGPGTAYVQNYLEDGPYMGVSYALQFTDVGSLSFSAAYAKMDGQYKDNYLPFKRGVPPDLTVPAYNPAKPESFNYKGSSDGTSLGITWTSPLGQNSNYFIDLRRQRYSMDAKDKTGSAAFTGAAVKTVEIIQGITAGVQVYF